MKPVGTLPIACALLLAVSVTGAAAQAAPVRQDPPEPHADHGKAQTPSPAGDTGTPDGPRAGEQPGRETSRSPVPPVTDADRAAAFPDVRGHVVHDDAVHYLVLFDGIEWRTGDGGAAVAWDTVGWIGRDLDRVWFRTEGIGHEGGVEAAEAHLLYGRAIGRWWDLVAGVRQDVRPGPARTWAAVGVQGLAPYWFEVEATGYVGESGRTQLRVETEYDLLLTNRLVVQPRVELDIFGRSDPERGIGAGLSSADAAVRLRYEFRRELAPYIGVIWTRRFFGTADLAEAAGHPPARTRLVLGMRVWF